MADITNRSPFIVTVERRPELARRFPFSPRGQSRLREYVEDLRRRGFKPKVAQGTDRWQLRVRHVGRPQQIETFGSLADAEARLAQIEADAARGLMRDYARASTVTVAQLIERYIREECPRMKGGDTYTTILRAMLEDSRHELELRIAQREAEAREHGVAKTKLCANRIPMANLEWLNLPLSQVRATDIEDFVEERLQHVQPATVDRQLDLLAAVFKVATTTWGYYLDVNPMTHVRRPRYFNERNRRLTHDEEVRLIEAARELDAQRSYEQHVKALAASEVQAGKQAPTHYARVKAVKASYAAARAHALEHGYQHIPLFEAFLQFQLATAARRGETLGLLWPNINLEAQTAWLPTTKNGRGRHLAVRRDILEQLQALPRTSQRVFDLGVKELANGWARMCEIAGIEDLRIHDLRHEAISRAAESGMFTTVLDLQAFSGHRDTRSLTRYTHLCATSIARTLERAEAQRLATHKGRQRLSTNAMPLVLATAGGATEGVEDDTQPDPPSNVVAFPRRGSAPRVSR